MSGPANLLPADDTLCAWERALLDRQLETLDRLAEMGMGVAGAIHGRVTADDAAGEPDAVLHHAALDFARVSRAVRMTLALQSRLVRDFKTPVQARARAANDAFEDIEPGSMAAVWLQPVQELEPSEKSRLRDAVRQAAEASGLEAETVERLTAEASDRLERDDIDHLMHRPFDELVAFICAELGLAPLPLEGGEAGSGGERTTLKRKAPEGSPPAPFASMAARTPPSPPFPPGGGRESGPLFNGPS